MIFKISKDLAKYISRKKRFPYSQKEVIEMNLNLYGKHGSLMKKWAPVIESTQVGRKIEGTTQAAVMSVCLENQYKLNKGYLPESQNVTSDMATFQQYAMPIVRRMLPELLAMNVTQVQPMTGPTGLAYAMRFAYDDGATLYDANGNFIGNEIGYNSINPSFTGSGTSAAPSAFTTGQGELLSNYSEVAGGTTLQNLGAANAPDGAQIARGKLVVESRAVKAGTRGIKTAYTIELQQDLAAVHGQDVETLMMEGLQYELQQELDRELLIRMRSAAVNTALGGAVPFTIDVTPNAVSAGSTLAGDGRWSQEKFSNVVNAIIAAANFLRRTTRLGPGNFAIVSQDVATALQSLNTGVFTANEADVDGTVMGIKVGTLHGTKIDVYVDTFATNSYALVGYKGMKPGHAGIVYLPYIPLMVQKTVGSEDGSPRIMLKTRYAILDNLFGSGLFYREIRFAGLNSYFGNVFTNITTNY